MMTDACFRSSAWMRSSVSIFRSELAASRRRQGLARKLLVAHGGVVNERGHDDRRLLQIVGLDAFERVHIQIGTRGVAASAGPCAEAARRAWRCCKRTRP